MHDPVLPGQRLVSLADVTLNPTDAAPSAHASLTQHRAGDGLGQGFFAYVLDADRANVWPGIGKDGPEGEVWAAGALLNHRLNGLGTTIFAEMSALAPATGAINLGQGFPDTDGPESVRKRPCRHCGTGGATSRLQHLAS